MPNQELVEYIKQALSHGFSKYQIKQGLLKRGWPQSEIDAAFPLEVPSAIPQTSLENISAVQESPEPFQKLPGFGSLFRETFKIFFAQWFNLLAILLLPLVFAAVLGAAWFVFFTQYVSILLALKILAFVFLIPSSILVLFLFAWSQLAFIAAIRDREQKIGIIQAYKLAKSNVFSFIILSAMLFLVIWGGIVLGIIPGIIFGVWFSLACYVLMYENLKGRKAFFRSRQLIRNYWWAAVGRIFLFNIVVGLILIAIAFPVLIILIILFPQITKSGQNLNVDFNSSFSFLSTIFTILIYENLRKIKAKEAAEEPSRRLKTVVKAVMIFGAVTLALAVIGVSVFFLVFSKRIAADNLRLSHQSEIRSSLEKYHLRYGVYPANLNQLSESGFMASIPTDPQTKQPYSYSVIAEGKDYSFCIVFQIAGQSCAHGEAPPFQQISEDGIYKGAEDSFSIRLPEGWLVNQAVSEGGFVLFVPQELSQNEKGSFISVSRSPAIRLGLQEHVENHKNSLKRFYGDYTVLGEQSVIVKGQPAYMLEAVYTNPDYTNPDGIRVRSIELIKIKNDTAFVVHGETMESNWDQHKAAFEETLNSFDMELTPKSSK